MFAVRMSYHHPLACLRLEPLSCIDLVVATVDYASLEPTSFGFDEVDANVVQGYGKLPVGLGRICLVCLGLALGSCPRCRLGLAGWV